MRFSLVRYCANQMKTGMETVTATEMERRYFKNSFANIAGIGMEGCTPDVSLITKLIKIYVDAIVRNTQPSLNQDFRGDLYVGDAGIAFMFWKLARSPHFRDQHSYINLAREYIRNAKAQAKKYQKQADERCAFLLGNAGIYAVGAIINATINDQAEAKNDLDRFAEGFQVCKKPNIHSYGSDELLVGRAGYLSGIYWINDYIKPEPFKDNVIIEICEAILDSGRRYAHTSGSQFKLMYQYHGTEYLGAAHGLSGILHMLLESPWFKRTSNDCMEYGNISKTKLLDIRETIDQLLNLQEMDGNFPVALESQKQRAREKRLVHWCHGGPGIVYLMAKAYLLFGDIKYLDSCKQIADLIWQKGLLIKGPGICHGIAGNGYVFLLLYRLTRDEKYLYRANKFVEFLNAPEFKQEARTPDRPYSLYEGLAGTVCFLIDVLEPREAYFPFMDVF